jgi:hypothetical protein
VILRGQGKGAGSSFRSTPAPVVRRILFEDGLLRSCPSCGTAGPPSQSPSISRTRSRKPSLPTSTPGFACRASRSRRHRSVKIRSSKLEIRNKFETQSRNGETEERWPQETQECTRPDQSSFSWLSLPCDETIPKHRIRSRFGRFAHLPKNRLASCDPGHATGRYR